MERKGAVTGASRRASAAVGDSAFRMSAMTREPTASMAPPMPAAASSEAVPDGNDMGCLVRGRSLDGDGRGALEEQGRSERRLAGLAVVERPQARRGGCRCARRGEIDDEVGLQVFGGGVGGRKVGRRDAVGAAGTMADGDAFERQERREGRALALWRVGKPDMNRGARTPFERLDQPQHPARQRSALDMDEDRRRTCRRHLRHRCDERSAGVDRGGRAAGEGAWRPSARAISPA